MGESPVHTCFSKNCSVSLKLDANLTASKSRSLFRKKFLQEGLTSKPLEFLENWKQQKGYSRSQTCPAYLRSYFQRLNGCSLSRLSQRSHTGHLLQCLLQSTKSSGYKYCELDIIILASSVFWTSWSSSPPHTNSARFPIFDPLAVHFGQDQGSGEWLRTSSWLAPIAGPSHRN